MFCNYDIIVVGAGHAGCEAAAAAANFGNSVLLITMNLQNIAQMSCNPAMGGIAKGQIVREIDALGGYSGIVTDQTTLQFRMLNKSKGPAMWSPRAQCDRMLFSLTWREKLESLKNLDFYQDSVVGLLKEGNAISGIKTSRGNSIYSKAVILTNGTFLNGIIHIGNKQSIGGRISENSSFGITEQLKEWGFETERLKTGTPPRIDGRSLDFSKFDEQKGDANQSGFSFLDIKKPEKQLSCWITYTSEEVHKILRSGFSESPMFAGRITGTGPRYCPSIEDKINRFSEKTRHQLFVEPEGFTTNEIYLNGFSSSLPEEVQVKALRKISGFENCKILRPGYAIEYDFFQPTQLTHSLETKNIKNLFFAGQINGTTGYEEAACQGIIAGINASQAIREKQPFILKRDEAYIGVLIDDLVTKGTDEPYRMFTSRAEFRLTLRQDNADQRLTQKSFELGLAKDDRMKKVIDKQSSIKDVLKKAFEYKCSPESINPYLMSKDTAVIKDTTKLSNLLSRPEINFVTLIEDNKTLQNSFVDIVPEVLEQADIQIKYKSYFEKEKEFVNKLYVLENQLIPDNFDYNKLTSLSIESRQKLMKVQPKTLGEANRISGVKPSDIQILTVFMGR